MYVSAHYVAAHYVSAYYVSAHYIAVRILYLFPHTVCLSAYYMCPHTMCPLAVCVRMLCPHTAYVLRILCPLTAYVLRQTPLYISRLSPRIQRMCPHKVVHRGMTAEDVLAASILVSRHAACLSLCVVMLCMHKLGLFKRAVDDAQTGCIHGRMLTLAFSHYLPLYRWIRGGC
jgi:hypothetical protein